MSSCYSLIKAACFTYFHDSTSTNINEWMNELHRKLTNPWRHLLTLISITCVNTWRTLTHGRPLLKPRWWFGMMILLPSSGHDANYDNYILHSMLISAISVMVYWYLYCGFYAWLYWNWDIIGNLIFFVILNWHCISSINQTWWFD